MSWKIVFQLHSKMVFVITTECLSRLQTPLSGIFSVISFKRTAKAKKTSCHIDIAIISIFYQFRILLRVLFNT